MTQNDLRDWMRLVLTPSVGPTTLNALLDRFESPAQVLSAPGTDLESIPLLTPKAIKSLQLTQDGKRESEVEKELAFLEAKRISVITREDPLFPVRLKQIPNPPCLLFYRGTLLERDATAVAVVGTRRCDSYGLKMTREIAGGLAARGITIISGLAHGIDAAAHQAALAVGGRTWAFLPCGFETIYPPEHLELAESIINQGAVLTEYPRVVRPVPRCFPPRNRLVSGCSLGVFLVQAPAKSGAMITARLAMEQNREVFALPGRVTDPASEGPHRLILDGAKLVRNVEDILEEIEAPFAFQASRGATPAKVSAVAPPNSSRKVKHPPGESLSPKNSRVRAPIEDPIDQRIVTRLEVGPVHIDRLAGDLDLPVRKVSERLLLLEMQGVVRRNPGMTFDLT